MVKKIAFIIISILALNVHAQKVMKQDLGINMAGLIIKNEVTINPALFYRYAIKNYQLRLQLSLNGNLNSKSSDGKNNQQSFGSFLTDSAVKFEPGKDVRYGFMLGIQKNKAIPNTQFTCYYGLDFVYVLNEFKEKGKGTIIQESQGFNQTTDIVIESKSTLKLFGAGLPVGITYKFGKQFYTSLEAKFIVAYKKFNRQNINNSTIKTTDQEFVTISEANFRNEGFDFGIKPLAGLCLGMYF